MTAGLDVCLVIPINHYMYADDLVVFPQVVLVFNSCLYVLIMGLDMMCNTIQNSVVMICRTKEHRGLYFPDIYLSGQVLNANYLGHIINSEMSDDIYRQCRKLYSQANMVVRKFYMCSDQVKINLFIAYCTSFYTAPLWAKFKKESLRLSSHCRLKWPKSDFFAQM